MSASVEITVPANADADDCLTDAAESYISEHPELAGYDLAPRWADDSNRETVTLTVPRSDALWWAWHDADASRWSPGEDSDEATRDADKRCAAWVAGESTDGPTAA